MSENHDEYLQSVIDSKYKKIEQRNKQWKVEQNRIKYCKICKKNVDIGTHGDVCNDLIETINSFKDWKQEIFDVVYGVEIIVDNSNDLFNRYMEIMERIIRCEELLKLYKSKLYECYFDFKESLQNLEDDKRKSKNIKKLGKVLELEYMRKKTKVDEIIENVRKKYRHTSTANILFIEKNMQLLEALDAENDPLYGEVMEVYCLLKSGFLCY